MFRCERCRTRFTNSEARTLEFCPLCQEDGEQVSLALKLFIADGPLTGAVDRTRRVVRELGGRRAPLDRSSRTSISSTLPAPRE
jgi:hypothetical protein